MPLLHISFSISMKMVAVVIHQTYLYSSKILLFVFIYLNHIFKSGLDKNEQK